MSCAKYSASFLAPRMPPPQSHPQLSRAARTHPDDDDARKRDIQRTTLVAVATNSALTVAQLVIGLFANAFSLVADAAHTLSDLVTDLLVLLAARHGADPADINHPYGHGRIETATTMLLGAVLAAVGVGFLWSSGLRLQNMNALPDLHPVALGVALLTLIAKESLFRFTLAAAQRLKAPPARSQRLACALGCSLLTRGGSRHRWQPGGLSLSRAAGRSGRGLPDPAHGPAPELDGDPRTGQHRLAGTGA